MTAHAQPRVLIVEHQENAGIGHFAERLSASGVELRTVGPATGEPLPASLDGVDGLIVLGGSMGPTDDADAPWLPAARALLAEGVANEVPTLGICLGAQLLTTALGGAVRLMPGGPEVGLASVSFDEAAATDPLFGEVAGARLPTVQWHWLEAAELPPGAERLASNAACRNQAFRVGPAAWGVQFHPEALAGTAADWVVEEGDGLAEIGLAGDAVVGEVRAAEAQLRAVWGGVAERFAAVVRGARS
ncbi:type 1 glutamine amidotransferase [Leucobacter chromiireducens]|uniref:type 1 glutamine amidotransferase n=1 Tax=Leucobacter chromiireducens TaxID=283877 RepID=UPI000F644B67|nr:type 1 glutamine amidotransferase [Leucobacter chromiireducens]